MAKTYYNTTDYPVVVDSGCRTVGGRERIECDETPEIVLAIEVGTLVDVTPAKKPATKKTTSEVGN